MSIVVLCPYCDTRFTLQEDMNGKSMRCPNFECRQVFTVKAMEATAPPEAPPEPKPEPKPAPKPPPAAPVIAPPKAAKSAPPKPPPPAPAPKPAKPTKPAEFEVVDAVIVEAAIVSPPKVKEVVWSEGAELPPPPPGANGEPDSGSKPEPAAKSAKKTRKPLKPELADDDDPLPRRKKKSSRRPLIIALMLVGIAGAAIGTVFYVMHFQRQQEEKLAQAADEDYKKASYGEAAKKYTKLAEEYPSSRDVEKYKFFAELSSMQQTVRAVANRENYDPAVKRLKEFIEAQKDSPFIKPVSGYGRDVLEAGKKLGEDIAAFAEDRVNKCAENRKKTGEDYRPKNAAELERADKALEELEKLIKLLDPFRGPDDPPLERLQESLKTAKNNVKHVRDITRVIDEAKADLADPTDAIIQQVEAKLNTAGLTTDAEAVKLIADAKGRLRDLVKYEEDPGVKEEPPLSSAQSLLFVAPLGKPAPRGPAQPGAGTVFLCVARGILYALNEDTGALLWATRVGPDVTDPPAVARADLATGPTDVVVVTSNVGGVPAVACHVLKTGAVLWYQPLTVPSPDPAKPRPPVPAAGPAAVIGVRAFVPLRDAVGTVYEYDLITGRRVGRIRIGQPIAERGAVVRPGTGLLYVAADARRLYVIDADARDETGDRANPRCVQVIATGHLPGTLRTPPLFIGPDGLEPADRWMLLAQAEGTANTALRAFQVKPIEPPAPGTSLPETPAIPVIAVTVPGWVSFAPICDGERLAVATDTGAFRIFGVNQPGNVDKALFPYSAPPAPPSPDKPVPALVIPVEESTYWTLVAGQLQKARLAVVSSKGQEIVYSGDPVPVGEPVHAAQVNARRDTACAVVRSLNSSGCRAVAFDLRTGEIRWQRQLGLVPAKAASTEQPAPPLVQNGKFVLVDEDGGIVAVPATSGTNLEPSVLASAEPNATGPTVVASSADGKVAFAITPVNRNGPKFLIRTITGGAVTLVDEPLAPDALAGQPAVVGGALLVPTADGIMRRYVPGDGRALVGELAPGPKWRGVNRPANSACSTTPLSNSSFATSDGSKTLSRWDWPAGGQWSPAGAWELREVVAGPGAVFPPTEAGGSPRLVIAEASGNVWLVAADRPVALGKAKWRPDGKLIPAGKPGWGFATQTDPTLVTAAYVINGKTAVGVSPDRDEALWSVPLSDDNLYVGVPQPAGANRWVLTDLAGNVVVLDGTGKELGRRAIGLPGAVPAAASGVSATVTLTPLSDGSAVVIELPKVVPAMEPKKE